MSNNEVSLTLEKRTITGKKVAQLRADGYVPGVVYGQSLAEPVAIQAPLLEVQRVIKQAGRHHPVTITLDGKRRTTVIKSVDLDPVKYIIQNISFQAVKHNEKVTSEVPVRLVGEGQSPAERAGLVVLQTLASLEVVSLPADIPEVLELSVEHLTKAGQKLTIADITVPQGVEIPADADLAVASVYEPGAIQQANEAAGGSAEAVADVPADNGGDSVQDAQASEDQPGGKKQK